jgi:hypothetical protein
VKKIRVLDKIPVKLTNGTVTTAKIRRIGKSDPTYHGYVMLTLDVGGELSYCVAKETEIATDEAIETINAA